MIRVPVRDINSKKEIKPRVFDALIEKEQVLLDVKDSRKGSVVISLDDVLLQIDNAKQQMNQLL